MKQIEEITALLEKERGNRHVVVLHEYPDPDAIACGYAQRLINAAFNIETDILYTGEISHQQNIALTRALDCELIKFDETFEFTPYSGASFVDHQGSTIKNIISRLQDANVPILMIVDHHEQQELVQSVFKDIRRTGSNATIYAQYLEAMNMLDSSQREHILGATALLHGILTDTNGFIQANTEDLQAAAYLSKFRDSELLALIMNQSRSKHVMEIIQKALGNRMVEENFSLAGLGYLRAEDRDAIPEVADFLLTEENVHTVIAYGIVRDEGQHNEVLIGSLRTGKFTLDPDEFIKSVFGTDSEGHFFGGGKVTAGGFSIPIGFLSGSHNDKFDSLKWQVFDENIKQKILSKIGVNP